MSEKGIPRLAEIGLDVLEVQFGHGITMKTEGAKRIGSIAKDYDIILSVHAPYYINFNSKKKETREKSKEVLKHTCRIVSALGAERVVCHCGSYSGLESNEATKNIAKCLREVLDWIRKKGYEVKIGIETMGKKNVWGSLEEVISVSRMIDVFPVIDFGHMHARLGGAIKSKEDFEKIIRRYEDLKIPFLHSHFSCVEYNEKGELGHLPISAKEPDFALLVPVLKKRNYDIRIICESPLLDRDALVMKKML
ncbi:MAG: TIM barrel protein [Thermoplasmata archaeon]